MQSQLAKLIIGILVHIQGAGLEHIAAAVDSIRKVAGLQPGGEAPLHVADVQEFGNTYEVWVVVKRKQQ